ncbi:hypothetical protein BO70DRAFT_361519 [Aspergillus heteromorphus CBS 117.55]|uniref:Uncharacterized protein n=1 Tax=Aspergillus heteromorphus CBS 117.55 TaxID=1448321 RepID=A0A317WCA8_9EURO|nr:uncharacterized protein BO70DRAFT_361519 [Aspergillus heteromorphus CBS 117.55]PWY83401.1 hypothetical protein BO70DRAFT_361519 [Aspergillus heteromorphus CBS 117.55]
MDTVQVARTARFVHEEAARVHQGLGGWSQFSDQRARFENPKPYTTLESILRAYVPSTLNIDTTNYTWDALFDRLSAAETEWQATGQSATQLFAKAWLKVGENREVIDPWISLIPDSYGLAVVKSGVAIILKLAAKSAEKRQRIFKTFESIRTTIMEASYKKRTFQTDPEVSQAAKELYFAVVDAVEGLLCSLPVKRHGMREVDGNATEQKQKDTKGFLAKLRVVRRPGTDQTEDPEKIMQQVQNSARKFQLTVDRCRDEKIETIDKVSRDTRVQVSVLRQGQKQTEINTREIITDVHQVRDGMEGVISGVGAVQGTVTRTESVVQGVYIGVEEVKAELHEQGRRDCEIMQLIQREEEKRRQFAETQLALMDDSLEAKNQMLEFLMEDRKKKETLIERLQQRLRDAELANPPSNRSSAAVVSLSHLFAILAQPISPSNPNPNPNPNPNYESALQHPNNDLEIVLSKRGSFDVRAQGQAQSVLQNGRFMEWMNREHPDLLVVDANLRACALDSITAISLFSATFILSMARVQPQEVVTHFFCGLHTGSARKDPWTGPNGLVRSVIVQLLMALHQRDTLSINFIDSRSYLKRIEDQDLFTLCDMLHRLVCQFPPDTTVYCIIDGVSSFDKDLHGSFRQMAIVVDWLQYIVEDDALRSRFKVLMTIPEQSTRRFRQGVDTDQRIILSSSLLSPQIISSRSVEAGISRPSTPEVSHAGSPSLSPSLESSGSMGGGVERDREWEDEGYDEGYNEW